MTAAPPLYTAGVLVTAIVPVSIFQDRGGAPCTRFASKRAPQLFLAMSTPSDVFSMALVVATISGDHFPGLVTGRSRSCDGTPSASTFYPAAGSSSAPWLGSIPTAGPGKGSETGLAFRKAGSFKLLSSNSQLDNSHAPDITAFRAPRKISRPGEIPVESSV
mgnify:CR=1 FL=1